MGYGYLSKICTQKLVLKQLTLFCLSHFYDFVDSRFSAFIEIKSKKQERNLKVENVSGNLESLLSICFLKKKNSWDLLLNILYIYIYISYNFHVPVYSSFMSTKKVKKHCNKMIKC